MRRLIRIGTIVAIGAGLGLAGCAGTPTGGTANSTERKSSSLATKGREQDMRRLIRIGTIVAIGAGLGLAGCAGTPTGGTATYDGTQSETGETSRPTQVTPVERDASAKLGLAATQAEPAKGNDAWCGSMQLCWNALMDELNGGNPVTFDDDARNTEEVGHLNARLFLTEDLSADHYYTYAGPMTAKAKTEIEDEITERFKQKSDILDQLQGWDSKGTQLLYAMLYRQFSFATPFAVSDRAGWFGSDDNDNRATDVAYFEATDDAQRGQVMPLYYEDADHHAVKIATKDGDEIILVRSPEGESLDDIWQNATASAEEAGMDETAPLAAKETFKCPNLDIDLQREDYEWVGGTFNNGEWIIRQALQTLKLHLDNEGGEVKSEAAIVATKGMPMGEDTTRHFEYDDTFAMFVRDGNAGDDAYPYVGVLVSDITQFQDNATKS